MDQRDMDCLPAVLEEQSDKPAPGRQHALRRRILGLGLGAVLGFFLGIAMGASGLSLLPAGHSFGEFLIFLGGIFILLWLAILVQTVLHEAGHLVFGLATGYRFRSFTVGGMMLLRENGRLRLRMLSIAGMGGQCLMSPPPDRPPEEMPFVLYNLGGALMNLLSAVLFGALVPVTLRIPLLSFFFLAAALVGLVFAALNGIPMRTEMLDNDGKNIATLAQSPAARRALWLQLAINEQMAHGLRLREMPDAWFALPDESDWDNYMLVSLAVFRANRLLDAHDIAGAAALIDRLFAAGTAMAGIYRLLLTCDRIFCALLLDDSETAGRLLTKQQRLLMKKMRLNPGILRTEYALALLRDKNPQQAEKTRVLFEARAAKHPYPCEIESERELMELAAQRAARRQTSCE